MHLHRPIRSWRMGAEIAELGARTWVMAILNLTVDSFHAASRIASVEAAVTAARQAWLEGADILDVGAESTRPGSEPVAPEQEQQRLLPVIAALARELPQARISADTRHAETAALALAAGAHIINDVTGLAEDAMARLIAGCGCGAVLMHVRGEFASMHRLPPLSDPVACVQAGFDEIVRRIHAAAIDPRQVVLDPGFGFGKNLDENFPLLARLNEFHRHGFPLLAGVSRKSFIGHALGRVPSESRLNGSLAAITAAALAGAHIVRVHDVRPAVEALRIADRVLAAAKPAGL